MYSAVQFGSVTEVLQAIPNLTVFCKQE